MSVGVANYSALRTSIVEGGMRWVYRESAGGIDGVATICNERHSWRFSDLNIQALRGWPHFCMPLVHF